MRRWVLALAVAAGCGPVAYVSQVTRGAQTAVDDARAARADKYSLYYWTRATQYLHMARDVAGHADFQGANRFGRLSQEAARLAKAQAEDPNKHPVNPMDEGPKGGIAPAKDDKGDEPPKPPGKRTAPVAPAKEAP